MSTVIKYASLLSIILMMNSCSKEDNENQNCPIEIAGWEYFPTDSGLTRFYQVDSVYWDSFTGVNDTISYELKEIVAGNFIDNQGRTAQRIERFRKDSNGNWIIYKVWSSIRTTTTAETVEDNIRVIKLTFPCSTGVSWNGNAYNALGDKTFEYTACNVSGSSYALQFPQTATVNQDDEPGNLLNDRNDLEKYATNVGMYYRLNSFVEFNFITGDTISGFIYTEKLTSYTP